MPQAKIANVCFVNWIKIYRFLFTVQSTKLSLFYNSYSMKQNILLLIALQFILNQNLVSQTDSGVSLSKFQYEILTQNQLSSDVNNALAPQWAHSAIWYQIFVERFNNGDHSNDPSVEFMKDEKMGILPPVNWKVTPWTQSWYALDDWMDTSKLDFNSLLQYRRYGGDLKGVLDKIDYLQELGINAVYFNPLNDAPSLHKYDARNYHHIDVNFGPDPIGDMALIQTEDLNDPSTWNWTTADKLFLEVVDSLHSRGIKVILDYSWNHTGTQFTAWLDVLKNQSSSPYKDWFNITRFDNPNTPENEFSYEGWMGNAYMPEVKKVNITTNRQPGHPYEGNTAEQVKKYIYNVTKRWLEPGQSKGIDGFRLDVADHVGMGFWRDWRAYVKSINPDAYLVGEIWWEQWPNHLMDPVPYLKGDVFDAVMFYQIYRPARYFFADTDYKINAEQFADSLNYHYNRIDPDKLYAMMNTSSSHDAPRLLTSFYNTNKYKYHANIQENPNYKTGKPNEETFQRLQLYLTFQFTSIGAPHIWNGEEMGMWGADDPHCRKPLMWPELTFNDEKRQANQNSIMPVDEVKFNYSQFALYKKLIQLRKSRPELRIGDFKIVKAVAETLIYERSFKGNSCLVIFNLSDKAIKYELPQSYKNKVDLVSGIKYNSEAEVQALSAAVLGN